MGEKARATALAKQAAAGDREAFVTLIDLHRRSLYATAIAVTKDEDSALDAVQDTILTLWEKIGSLRDPAAFKTWMTRILVNHCLDGLRLRSRELPLDDWDGPAADSDRDAAMDVQAALAKLAGDDRLLLQLYYYEDLSAKEIAGILSIRPETVRMRLSRGRKRFRQAYEKGAHYEKQ